MAVSTREALRGVAFFVALLAYGAQVAYAQTDRCVATGYTVGFFNGVANSPVQAADSLAAIRATLGDSYKGEPIQYEVFYNHTGCGPGVAGTLGCLEDLAETFVQRARQIDASGELAEQFEFFWESLTGDKTLTDKVTEIYPSTADTFSALYADVVSKVVAGYAFALSNPPTNTDYANHNARLDSLALQGQKLLLVAHSQGNLFATRAFDYIAPKIGSTSVSLIHIAPASTPTNLRGGYVLANIDLIINALRAQGLATVPDNNIALSPSRSDVSGHELVATYLDPTRPARAQISLMLTTEAEVLKTPVGAQPMRFRGRLWNAVLKKDTDFEAIGCSLELERGSSYSADQLLKFVPGTDAPPFAIACIASTSNASVSGRGVSTLGFGFLRCFTAWGSPPPRPCSTVAQLEAAFGLQASADVRFTVGGPGANVTVSGIVFSQQPFTDPPRYPGDWCWGDNSSWNLSLGIPR